MKKYLKILLLSVGLTLATAPVQQVHANPIAAIIKKAVIWVIKAVDLIIQRLQNKTIWLSHHIRENSFD